VVAGDLFIEQAGWGRALEPYKPDEI